MTYRSDERYVIHMTTTQILEVRFTAKRALYWTGIRWNGIARDKARDLIALGQAVELKEGEWI